MRSLRWSMSTGLQTALLAEYALRGRALSTQFPSSPEYHPLLENPGHYRHLAHEADATSFRSVHMHLRTSSAFILDPIWTCCSQCLLIVSEWHRRGWRD